MGVRFDNDLASWHGYPQRQRDGYLQAWMSSLACWHGCWWVLGRLSFVCVLQLCDVLFPIVWCWECSERQVEPCVLLLWSTVIISCRFSFSFTVYVQPPPVLWCTYFVARSAKAKQFFFPFSFFIVKHDYVNYTLQHIWFSYASDFSVVDTSCDAVEWCMCDALVWMQFLFLFTLGVRLWLEKSKTHFSMCFLLLAIASLASLLCGQRFWKLIWVTYHNAIACDNHTLLWSFVSTSDIVWYMWGFLFCLSFVFGLYKQVTVCPCISALTCHYLLNA